ncbi:hypothetical protein BDQ17DRAFT_1434442 [Cyathus striatus]|nr:hypothetical protein BDQ17DRAFT_1434442 [Cyathus striatus]
MAPCSTRSATTQASSITPTESAPPVTHETRSESHKCGTSAADLTAQPPTKKQAKANKPITDNEETKMCRKNRVKKLKTSEMKRAEDAAADEEGVPDLTAYGAGGKRLPVAPPKRGPSSDTWKKLKKNRNLMDMKPITKVKIKPNKKHTEDQISKGKGSDKSNDNHTEDSTSKNKEGDIIMTSPPVSPPHVTSKPGTVDTVDIANISPKGSSRSEGGILRGNALGNHPNATDFHSAIESTAVGPVKGWFGSADPVYMSMKSGFMPNAPLSLDIEASSIQSKSAGSSAASSRAVSHSHTPSLIQRGGISEQCTEELVEVLKIPRDILERLPWTSSCISENRTWPIAKATKKEIVTVFVSSSAWYENYSNFDKIADFPTMQSWLVEDEDSPSDLDLWGFESIIIHFWI